MPERSYHQYCGLARALDLVGERWTLLIVRELARGPRRYSDVLAALPGIGTSLLAERLKKLEGAGIVTRTYLPPPAASTVYELTEDGEDLATAMQPLVAWGARRLGRPGEGDTVRLEWVMQFMSAMADHERSKGVRETYEIRLPQGSFHVVADDGRLTFREGSAPGEPDLVVETDLEMMAELGMGSPDRAKVARRLKSQGSPEIARRALYILSPALREAMGLEPARTGTRR